MVASDCRGISLLFRLVFVALGSLIIPEETDKGIMESNITITCFLRKHSSIQIFEYMYVNVGQTMTS